MSFSFHPGAEEEFNRTIEYYEGIEPGLGLDFAAEVYFTIQRSVEFPKAWAVLEGDVRRSLVRRFPYGVLYSQEQDALFIIAIMNLHRDPDYWKQRMRKVKATHSTTDRRESCNLVAQRLRPPK